MEKREIKFRAWDENEKHMVDWEEIDDENLCPIILGDHYHPLQYTGLKDKNGKEIYEGDLIKTSEELWSSKYALYLHIGIYPVTFEKGCFQIEFDLDEMLSNAVEENHCEIIGNIFENPDLVQPPLSNVK